VPVQLTAAASDFWGAVSLSWTFGDGGSASGGDVTHIFGAAASRTVTESLEG
jgi:PKD domain